MRSICGKWLMSLMGGVSKGGPLIRVSVRVGRGRPQGRGRYIKLGEAKLTIATA